MSIPENARVHVSMLGTKFSREYYNWIMDVFEFMRTSTHSEQLPGCELPHNVHQVKITVSSDGKWFLYTNPVITPSSISDRLKMRKLGIKRKSRRPVSIGDMKATIKHFQTKNHFSAEVSSGRLWNSYFFTVERQY